MDLCKHGKPPATDEDLRRYNEDPEREYCRKQGDCECPICSRVCWVPECMNNPKYPPYGKVEKKR